MLVTDRVTLGDVKVTADGYLEGFARTARTGVQVYRGYEAGRPDLDTVSVFRDEAEVFSHRSLDTFSKIPITVDHPAEPVTSKNWRKHAVGVTGDDVLRDGEHLKIGLKIKDQAAIDAVQAGKRELSVGYSTELVWQDGVAPDGTPYQAKQTLITANHIAIVTAGRAGPQCRIGDSWAAFSTERKDPPMSLKTVTVDGIPVEVTDQGATVINTLLARLADSKETQKSLEIAHATALATKDADLAKKDAEIDALKGKVLDAKALDAAVAARGDLVAKAKAIAPGVVTDGKTDSEIRLAVVTAKIGDAVKDKAPAYIDARFDILAEDAKPADLVRGVIQDGAVSVGDARAAAAKALSDRTAALRDGWKSNSTKAA